jgi:hypothetical protein
MTAAQAPTHERGGAALEYAARGWPCFPCAPNAKRPLTEHGLHDASSDLEQVERWWSRWPDANVALRTGEHFDVLDVDAPDGLDTLSSLVGGDHVELPPGPAVLTPNGGVHLYFAPTGLGNRARFRPGLDWRGAGGYVLAPPSIGPNGIGWRWWPGANCPDVDASRSPIEPVPGWLLELLTKPAPPSSSATPPPTSAPNRSAYAQAALRAETDQVRHAPVGARNDTLCRAAFALGQLCAAGQLDPGETAGLLLGAALAVGLPEAEARRTIGSGLQAGAAHPRRSPA